MVDRKRYQPYAFFIHRKYLFKNSPMNEKQLEEATANFQW